MDTSTGDIFTAEDMKKMLEQKPEKAKFMKMIPDEFVHKLQGMNRAGRRKFYREHKSEFNAV